MGPNDPTRRGPGTYSPLPYETAFQGGAGSGRSGNCAWGICTPDVARGRGVVGPGVSLRGGGGALTPRCQTVLYLPGLRSLLVPAPFPSLLVG